MCGVVANVNSSLSKPIDDYLYVERRSNKRKRAKKKNIICEYMSYYGANVNAFNVSDSY